jgi:hypothetical protein
MIAFKLSVNGEYICTAGVRAFGVLSATITWVGRKPENGRGDKTIEEELTADLGGLDSESKEHLKWWSQRLRVGDRLSIEVVETKRADKPKGRYRDDPKVVERAKRRYFERLKKELAASSKERASNKPVPPTRPKRRSADRPRSPHG